MKNLMLILMLALTLFSCQSEEVVINAASEVAKPALLQRSDVVPKGNIDFNIDKGNFDWDKKIATFTISHSGGCDPNYNFKFYVKPRMELNCGGNDTVYVVLNTNNNCERLDNTVVTFDFSTFIPCSDKIIFMGGRKINEFPLKPAIVTNNNVSQSAGIIKLGANDMIPQSTGDFNINTTIINLDKKIATFTIGHSGGCDPNYNFKFYYKPKLTMDCVVDTVHVVLSTKNNCKRLDNTVVNFDMATLTMCSKKIVFKGGTKELELIR
jgi:hypothetical protein